MTTVYAYMHQDSWDYSVKSLCNLTGPCKPLYYSSSEISRGQRKLIADHQSFELFLKKNSTGFFLSSSKVKIMFLRRGTGKYFTISVHESKGKLSVDDCLSILRALSIAGLRFGFGCDSDEYYSRNRYYTQIGANSIEAWVGRDLSRYLPGLYWITCLHSEELLRLKLDASAFPEYFSKPMISEDYCAMQYYESAVDWKLHQARLDDACFANPNIFSLRRILPELVKSSNNYADFNSSLRNWP